MAFLWILLVGLSYLAAASAAAVPGDCTFESGFCGYTQDLSDQFNWTSTKGKTPSSYTGPTVDHTTGGINGNYMYIETSWPRLNKERAVLVSPAISDITGNCLAFFYHMKGLNIRTLNVYTQESSGSRTLQWSLSGDQKSTDWSIAKFGLPKPRNGLKVVMEGFSGTGYMGDIAIDDIKVFEDPLCVVSPPEAKPISILPTDSPLPTVNKCGIKPQSTRIVGGTEALPGAWPWQAMLMYYSTWTKSWKQFCGGTLVTPEWVVTASHCINDIRPEDYATHRIRMGAHYINITTGVEQDIDIERIYTHPEYNGYPVEYNYDIALIKLKKPAMIGQRIATACIPDNLVQFATGTECYITGWGTLKSGGDAPWKLQEAKVPLVSTAECTKNGSYSASQISPMMQCAGYPGVGGIDTCQGDSGGPLVCENNSKWYLVGVTSWGYSCAGPKYPGVYAKVEKLKQWVANTMANHV